MTRRKYEIKIVSFLDVSFLVADVGREHPERDTEKSILKISVQESVNVLIIII